MVAFGTGGGDVDELGGRGADRVVIHDATVEERVAHALRDWSIEHDPWAVLAPQHHVGPRGRGPSGRNWARGSPATRSSSRWRRTGDLAWKPAFGGTLVAAIRCTSPVQMVTVRAGMWPRSPHARFSPESTAVRNYDQSRVEVLARARDDDLDVLADADAILAVGQGVNPAALRRTRTAAARAARRDRRHPQGHRLGMVPGPARSGSPDGRCHRDCS